MIIFAFKVIAAPFLIALASIAGRRWGPGVSGWLVGFPLVSGPISILFLWQHGAEFAAQAAVGTLAGVVAVGAFCTLFCWAALRATWLLAFAAASGAFAVTVALLDQFSLALVPTFFAALAALTLALRLIPVPPVPAQAIAPPRWDLPVRMFTAFAFVLALSTLADRLGPQLAGLLSPFPSFATILAVFAYVQRGPGASVRVMRGILTGLYGFVAFFLVVGALLAHVDPVWAFSLAGLAALVVSGALLRFVR